MQIGDDIIDSRDVNDRIHELEDDLEDLHSALNSSETDEEREEAQEDIDDWENSDEGKELELLYSLRADTNSSEWVDGLSLIHEDYFEDYARELAEDIGSIEKINCWPYNCIDWVEAASQLKYDYSEVEVGGNTYCYRAY